MQTLEPEMLMSVKPMITVKMLNLPKRSDHVALAALGQFTRIPTRMPRDRNTWSTLTLTAGSRRSGRYGGYGQQFGCRSGGSR